MTYSGMPALPHNAKGTGRQERSRGQGQDAWNTFPSSQLTRETPSPTSPHPTLSAPPCLPCSSKKAENSETSICTAHVPVPTCLPSLPFYKEGRRTPREEEGLEAGGQDLEEDNGEMETTFFQMPYTVLPYCIEPCPPSYSCVFLYALLTLDYACKLPCQGSYYYTPLYLLILIPYCMYITFWILAHTDALYALYALPHLPCLPDYSVCHALLVCPQPCPICHTHV